MRKYHLTTFGCQMNEHDSERMKGMLESLGYAEAAERARGRSDPVQHLLDPREGRRALRRPPARGQALKRRAPETVIGVGGCWAQSVKDEVFQRFPFVDVAFGPGQVHKLAEFLTSDSLTAQGFFEFEGFTGDLPAKRAREFQGWLQISVGCNCVCSYCIVPSTRGREVSRDPDTLIAEVERLAADGVTRGHAARPERQLLRPRPAPGQRGSPSRSCSRASTPSPGSSGSATRARTPRTCART